MPGNHIWITLPFWLFFFFFFLPCMTPSLDDCRRQGKFKSATYFITVGINICLCHVVPHVRRHWFPFISFAIQICYLYNATFLCIHSETLNTSFSLFLMLFLCYCCAASPQFYAIYHTWENLSSLLYVICNPSGTMSSGAREVVPINKSPDRPRSGE